MVIDRIGFLGAGRVARTLAQAWAEAGQRIIGVASRQPASAESLAARIEGCVAFESAQQLADHADLVFVTVADDAIEPVTASVRWRSGQGVVHCSGATEVGALAAAARQGAYVGGFHPLQIFSDPEEARRHLRGSYVAIEAEPPLAEHLEHLAARLGLHPLALPPGVRVRYHVAANYAASFLLGSLKEAEDWWQACGLPRDQALAALMPLANGALAAARRQGLASAIAGPFARGDVGVVRKHLDEADRRGGDAGEFYRLVASRLVSLARERGLARETLAELERLLQRD